MATSENFHDVIVVGGGISGLYAARCLTKEGVDVIALEAQDHVGGRSLTQWDPAYGFADMGGAYVGPAQTKIISLVEELGGSVYPEPDDGKSVLLDGAQRILFTEEKFPLTFIFSMMDLNNALTTLDAMSMEVPLKEPWNAPKAKEWDSISVEQFIKKTCWTRASQDVIITAVDLIFVSTSSSDVSLLVFLHLNRVCGGMRAMIGSVNGLQAYYLAKSSIFDKRAGGTVGVAVTVTYATSPRNISLLFFLHELRLSGGTKAMFGSGEYDLQSTGETYEKTYQGESHEQAFIQSGTYVVNLPGHCVLSGRQWKLRGEIKQFLNITAQIQRFAADLLVLIFENVELLHLDDLSLLGTLNDIRVSGGVRRYIGLEENQQGMKITEGSSSVSEKMAAELKDRVKLNTTVTSIDQTKDPVELRTENGDIYRCRQVVMATCPLVLRHIDIKPQLPSVHLAYIDHKAESNMIKTVIYYKKRYWADKGLKGEFMAFNRICTYGLDDTKADGSHPAIMCFVDGKRYSNLTKEERKQKLLDLLVEVFGLPEMAHPVHYVEKEWGLPESDRYHGICVHSSPPGFLTKYRALWGESQGSMHFASSEAALTMRGYMDGGLRAAEAATAKVLKALGRTPNREYETEPVQVPFVPARLEERLLPSLPTFVGILVALAAVPLAYFVSKM